MGKKEAIFGFSALLFGVVAGIAVLLGAEWTEGSSGGSLVFIVGALVWFAWVGSKLKKQGVPFWCPADLSLSGRRHLHRFADIGDPYVEPRKWECSLCGVHREVWKKSSGNDSGGAE